MADEETPPVEEDKTPTAARLKTQEAAPEPAPVEPAVEPKIGEVVHYVYGDMHVPASIMEVHEDGSVRLRAHDNSLSASPIFFDASGADGTFHYPEE